MPSTRTENLGPMAKFLSPKGRATAAAYVQREVQFARVLEARERKRVAEAAEVAALEKRRRLECAVTDEIMAAQREADAAEARMKAVTKAATISVSTVEDDTDDDVARAQRELKKKRVMYEEEVKGLITPSADLTWDDMFGQRHAVDAMKLIVDAVNGNYDSKPHNAVLLCGPPGTGKDQLAKIAASQIDGCTLFDIPKGFGSHKPRIWEVLFDLAKEMEPAILFFNECDGVLNGSAVPALKRIDWDTKYAPVIIGATNHPLKLEDAIQKRFGDPIMFTPFDDSMRKGIVQRMQAPSDFASDDADWESLLAHMQGMDGRTIVQVCKTVAARVERECRNAQIDVRNITLADFQARLQTRTPTFEGMSPTAKQEVVDWIQMTFCEATEEQCNTYNSRKELVVSVFEDLLAAPVMPDDILRKLGVSDISRLRTDKLEVHRSSTFMDNLKSCFAVALPECEFMDLKSKIKQRLSRTETCGGSGTVIGYTESEPGEIRRGFVIRKCRYQLALHDPDRTAMARQLGGCISTILPILALYRFGWNQGTIDQLLRQGARPTLTTIHEERERWVDDDGYHYLARQYKCTFQHPSGALLTDIWTPVSLMAVLYTEHVERFHGM